MKFIKIFLSLAILSIFIPFSQANESDEALSFFNQYVELGHNFDVALIELYKPDAIVKMYRRYPLKLERSLEVTGVQWAALVKKTMHISKERNDKSLFSNIDILTVDGRFKIKAYRYSTLKCYTDSGYYIILEKQNSGVFKIHEEYFETQPNSSC